MHKLKDVNQLRLQFKDLTVPDFPDIILQELFVLFKIACICSTDADVDREAPTSKHQHRRWEYVTTC